MSLFAVVVLWLDKVSGSVEERRKRAGDDGLILRMIYPFQALMAIEMATWTFLASELSRLCCPRRLLVCSSFESV